MYLLIDILDYFTDSYNIVGAFSDLELAKAAYARLGSVHEIWHVKVFTNLEEFDKILITSESFDVNSRVVSKINMRDKQHSNY